MTKLVQKKLAMVCAAATIGFTASAKTSTDYVSQDLVAMWDGHENSGRYDHRADAKKWVDLVRGVEVDLPDWVAVEDHSLYVTGDTSHVSTKIDWLDGLLSSDAAWTIEIVQQSCGWTATDDYLNLQNVFNTPRGTIGYRQNLDKGFYFLGPSSAIKCGLQNWVHGSASVMDLHTTSAVVGKDKSSSSIWMDGVKGTVDYNTGKTYDNNSSFTFFSNPRMSIRVFAIRVYSRALTQAEIESNHEIDVKRFVEGSYASNDRLEVGGVPDAYGEVWPAYGVHEDYAVGDEEVCVAPASWTNEEETVAATCAGYKVYTNNVICAEGEANAFSYKHPDCEFGSKLIWQWTREYKVTAAATEGGMVSKSSEWVAEGATFTATATPMAGGHSFSHWRDAAGNVISREMTLLLPVTEPMALTAVFGSTRFVGGELDDYATLSDALAAAVDCDTIVIRAGTNTLEAQCFVTNAITICGATGNPKDVILRMAEKAGSRHLFLNNAQATVSGLTLENGSGGDGGSVYIDTLGGTVANCVFSGNKSMSGSGSSQGGAIWLDSSAALVTHCVFTNNLGGTGLGTNASHRAGGAHAVCVRNGTVRNCLFVGNGDRDRTNSRGGVVVMEGGVLDSCTFAKNADGYCAGARPYNSSAVVRNCVFGDCDCPHATSAAMAVMYDPATAGRFDHCCSSADLGGSWIVSALPFVDAAHGDWSPAATIIDKATSYGWMAGATDLAGNARVSGSAPDIGCYEKNQDEFGAVVEVSALRAIAPYEATFTVTTFGVGDKGVTCHWDWNGDGTWDDTSAGTTNHVFDIGSYATKVKVVDNVSGAAFEPAAPFDLLMVPKIICVDCNSKHPVPPYQSWDCAATTLADAYAVAVDGCEIVVATGTYGVSSVIEVTKEVKFRSATGNPRDVVLRMADKAASRHFFLNNAQSALLGLTLENASGLNGGSVFIEAFGGMVSNCVFSGNKSSSGWGQQGGAIYLNSTDALVTHCVFTNNLGGSAGDINSGDSQGGGHALHIEKGNVRNCLFVGNGDRTHKASKGGVVVMAGGALENCTFVKNADSHCAGVHAYNAAAVVRNCLFAEYDCPDATSEAMAVIFNATTASRYDHCCSPLELGGSWVKTDDPQFRKPAKGDWRLKATSPAVNAGVWCDWMDGATDLLGNPRTGLDNPDIGCYECPCSGLMLFVR